MKSTAKIHIAEDKSTDSVLLSSARQLEALYKKMNWDDEGDLYSQVEKIESSMSEFQADGIDEAAVQLMLVAGFLECLRTNEEVDCDDLIENMERLTRSALSAVVRKAGIDLAEYGGDRYAPDRTNPFRKESRLH